MKPDLIRFDGDDDGDGDGEGSSSEQFQEFIESLPTNLRLLLMQQVPPVEPPQTRELYLELLDLLKRTQEGIAKLAERLPPLEQLLSELPFECQKVW